jgi:hypothetical protein
MQNQKFEAQLQAVKERLDQARGTSVEGISFLSQPCVCSTKSCGSITIDFRTHREAIARGRRIPTTDHRSYIEHHTGRCQSLIKDPERGRRVSTLHFDHVTSALTGTNELPGSAAVVLSDPVSQIAIVEKETNTACQLSAHPGSSLHDNARYTYQFNVYIFCIPTVSFA